MESDSFFCQLFKHLPQTLFELLDLPGSRASLYRFDSVELKKSLRIDGLFVPRHSRLPVYIVEVQFRRMQKFYANLFAKVFCYLEENKPKQDWVAVAIFPTRSAEPKHLTPYEDLLRSKRVRRIYLDELSVPTDPPAGLGILQLLSAPPQDAKFLVHRLVKRTQAEFGDAELGRQVIELAEELLIRRFAGLSREEIRNMFQLTDIRKTRVWQEAAAEGREEGKSLAKKETLQHCLAMGMSHKQIAEILKLSLEEVRRLAKS